ncbi:MAG: C1 family peptidase [Flavobacteriales bacterium]
MPIRIRPDQNQGSYSPRPSGPGGGGGGGGLMQFIPLLLGLFGRNPKMLLIIAVIAGAYMLHSRGCGSDASSVAHSENALATGAVLDIEKYKSTSIYEPLADNKRNPLPEEYSLLKYAPSRRNQGQQGSCVAWASAYAARSIMQTRESGTEPNSSTFSPAFLYNQIKLEGCQGAYLPEAMKVMHNRGLAPWSEMSYDENDCNRKPTDMALRKAEDFKIDGYERLSGGRDGTDAKVVNMLAIKQNIAQGAPVVIGMIVGGSFMQNMMGKELWKPERSDYSMMGFGGHAMCVIGYDDFKFARDMGGFQIMNSWGEEWGVKGVAWVSYDDFEHFCREAYGIHPAGDASAPQTNVLNVQFGIVLNANDQNLPLEQIGKSTFATSRKMTVNEEFKLQITNNLECYVYIFGQETDGSSYVLFPYTAKHSPYCGITGTRLFPRDHSFYPDDKGQVDYFAIVVSKEALDYDDFAKKLSAAAGNNYDEKLSTLVDNRGVSLQAKSTANISVDFKKNALCGVVIEVQK